MGSFSLVLSAQICPNFFSLLTLAPMSIRLQLVIDGVPDFDLSQLTPDHEVYLTIMKPRGSTSGNQGPVLRFAADVRHVKNQGAIITAHADYDAEAGEKMPIVSKGFTPDPNHDA